MEEIRYTVVVSSCDEYSDLWDPFFKIIMSEWPELKKYQIPIVLNTERKTYQYKGLNIRTLQLYGENDNPAWSTRLKETLERIKTEYIIFLLDDFYMHGDVRTDKIEQCIGWMDSNQNISSFCFKETYASKNIRDNKYEGFERRPLFGKYKFNCQAALWRKDRLMSYLQKDENPWEWETMGNWRSYKHPTHRFYSHIPGEPRVFPYIYEEEGATFWESGVYRGKWVLPSVKSVFEKNNVEVDFSVRGIVLEEDFKTPKRKEDMPGWKQHLWFLRPVYCKAKEFIVKIPFVFKNMHHFF